MSSPIRITDRVRTRLAEDAPLSPVQKLHTTMRVVGSVVAAITIGIIVGVALFILYSVGHP